MIEYTQRADGVKTDACEDNSGHVHFFSKCPENLVFR